MENDHILGELQNGFREGRRLEDKIFLLGQSIEIAILKKQPCVQASLISPKLMIQWNMNYCGKNWRNLVESRKQ